MVKKKLNEIQWEEKSFKIKNKLNKNINRKRKLK